MSADRQEMSMSGLADADGLSKQHIIDSAIAGRFANRRFSDRAVPKELLEGILDIARFAPSGANIQPWRVYALSGKPKENLSARLLQAHREEADRHTAEYSYYAAQLPEPYLSRRAEFGKMFYGALGIEQTDLAARARQTSRNYEFFGAPVGLIVTIDRRLAIGSWLDLGMLIQNIMIAARGRGLETCPQETFAKYHLLLRERIPIAPEEIVVCGISIGFAADDAASAGSLMTKVPLGEFTEFIGFD